MLMVSYALERLFYLFILVTLAYDFMLRIHTLCNRILLSINKVYILPSLVSCYLNFHVMNYVLRFIYPFFSCEQSYWIE
jgi:hypothetical protein